MLANVVGLGEVDEDLADEIGQECREKVLLFGFGEGKLMVVWGGGEDTGC
jgi:hypothetical protein